MQGGKFSLKEFIWQRNSRSMWRQESGLNGNLETAKDNRDLSHPERSYKEYSNIKVTVLLTSLLTEGEKKKHLLNRMTGDDGNID